MTIHLPFGGSTAARTLGCPAWHRKSENLPRKPAGAAAIEGSMHHEVQEKCQRQVITPEACLGLVYTEDDVSRGFGEDDLELSNIAFNATNALLDNLDIDQIEVEPFVQLVEGTAGGSIDLLGLSADGKTALVLDYKFGSVPVSVENNAQLLSYAASACADPSTADMFDGVDNVVIAIIQPRKKGVTFTQTLAVEEVAEFRKKYYKAVVLADEPNAPVIPGPHCRFCPAAPYCSERRLNVVATNLLGKEELSQLQAAADVVIETEAWLKEIKEEMYLQISRGVPLNGWKLVNKRATRKWIHAPTACKAITATKKFKKADLHTRALMSPAQMEKFIKKAKVDIDLTSFIESVSSGTTIAPSSDAAEAVIVSDVQGHLADIMGKAE